MPTWQCFHVNTDQSIDKPTLITSTCRQDGPTTRRHEDMLLILLLFGPALTHKVMMPIRPENRWLYPIDWQQLSDTIRFDRAGARCERCARPHLRFVSHLGDGRWWDADTGYWRSDHGRRVAVRGRFDMASVRTTYVVLACAHLDHDPGHNLPGNLAALCQRCHMLHDAAEHRWQRWWNVFRVCAMRDLYEDPRLTRKRLAPSFAGLRGPGRAVPPAYARPSGRACRSPRSSRMSDLRPVSNVSSERLVTDGEDLIGDFAGCCAIRLPPKFFFRAKLTTPDTASEP